MSEIIMSSLHWEALCCQQNLITRFSKLTGTDNYLLRCISAYNIPIHTFGVARGK